MRIGIDCRKIADFGIGTYIRGLLGGLTELGDEEYVAFGPAAIAGSLPAGIEHVVINAPHYSVRELFVVGQAADAARLDLFHAPHYVVPLLRTPFVVTVHDLIHLHRHNPLQRMYARSMIGRAVRRSAGVLTVSRAVRAEMEALFGQAEKIAVAPNGVDAAFLQAGPKAEGRYFLYVGNDKPHKNVGRLVEAFERLGGPQLILAGGRFDRFRHRRGIQPVGFVDIQRLAALYRGAIALLLPSLEEGFGLPALEAMACGTAVITSRAPALLELTGDAALHVDAESVDAIAASMARALDDESLRRSMIRRGRERAAAFSWRRCAEITRDVYQSAFRFFKGIA